MKTAEIKELTTAEIQERLATEKENLVRMIERLRLSARAYDKVLRVARTLADLAGSEGVRNEDVMAALMYRRMDEDDDSFWL